MMALPRPFPLSEMSEEARRQKLAALGKKFRAIPLPEMSEEARQQSLARARKMLREFQLRNNLPIPPRAKKRKTTKVGPETPTSGGHSPEDAPKDRATSASPADDTTPPGSAHPACAGSPCTSGMASPENYDAERSPLPSEESKTMSSTDSLPQVSRPLHGLMPESSSNLSGKDQTSSNDMKNPESRYQDLSLGLDSSSPTHNQLTKKTQELNHEKQDALDQLEILKQDFEQELMKEQGALRQQLQEHTQTIEILLSEKSELHTALMHTQQAHRHKAGEAEALANRLQSSRRRVSELEQTLSDVSAQQKQADKTNQELTEEHENLKVELCTQIKSNEALKQCNSELEEKLRVLLMEKSAMQRGMDELHKKLQMRELAKPPPLQPGGLNDNQQLRQTLEGRATPPQKPPAGPSEMEQRLQAEDNELQKKLEHLAGQLQAQVKDNEALSRLNQEQEVRLLQLEREAELWEEQAADRKHILETVESDRVTISRALSQNRELKEQLEELQNGFIRLSSENMEVTSALHSERYVKKELAKKLGELQEHLAELKETMALKSKEAQALQEQRDQYLSHLQQYIVACQQLVAAYQQLATEKEMLQKQLVLQTQRAEKLRHEEAQSQAMAEMMRQELQGTQERPEAANQQNQQLQTQSGLMTLPGEGNAVEGEQAGEDEQHPQLSIPEDLDSPEAMVAPLKSALARAKEQEARLRRQLKEQKRRCQHLARQETSSQCEPEASPPTGTGGESVSGDINQALQGAMKKLQHCFAEIMQDQLDLKDRMEELEHRCLQLSGEIDTIGECIALHQNQRAVMKEHHRLQEDISCIANDKEDMTVPLLEVLELHKTLVGEHKGQHGMFPAAAQSPAAQDTTASPAPQELGADNGQDLPEGNLADDVGSVKGEALQGKTVPETSTAQQKMQLLHETQYTQDHHGLGDNPCIPFFYQAEKYGEAKVLVI